MKPASKEQIKAINAALAVRGLMPDKPVIIGDATNGRTTHSAELTFDEAKVVLKSLLSGTAMQPKNKMISKMFAMAHEMGWVEKKTIVSGNGMLSKQNDYSSVYEWVNKYGYLHKPLREYQYNEIPKLLTQFEMGPYKHYLSK